DGEPLAGAILNFHNVCCVAYRAIDCDLALLGYLNHCATHCGIAVALRVGTIFAKVRSTLAKSGLCTGGRTWALFPTHGPAGLPEVRAFGKSCWHAQENLSLGCPWPLTLP